MILLTYLQGLQPCPRSVTQGLPVPWQLPGTATGSHDKSQRRWHQTVLTTKQNAQVRVELSSQTQGMRAVARERRRWANSGSPSKGEGNINNTRVVPPRPLPNSPHSSRRTSGKSKEARQGTDEQRGGWKWGIRVEGLKGRRTEMVEPLSAAWRQQEGGSEGSTHQGLPSPGQSPRSTEAKGGWTERSAQPLPARWPPPWRSVKMTRGCRELAGRNPGCGRPRTVKHRRRQLPPRKKEGLPQDPCCREGPCASLTSLQRRRVGELEWSLLSPPLEPSAAAGGVEGGVPPLRAEPRAGRRGCGRGLGPPS